jgi:hypothetical protein
VLVRAALHGDSSLWAAPAIVLSKMKKKAVAVKTEAKRRSIAPSLLGFGWFVAGTLFGLYIVQWFVTLLPGPHVAAALQGVRGTSGSGNMVGCTYYLFSISTDEPTEYIYAKFQFPDSINNFKVGFPQEAETADAKRLTMQIWELGKDAKGDCTVVKAAINNDADVQASAAGNMIAVHSSKLPPNTTIVGMVATTNQKSSVTPIPKTYTEGAYEYLKLGQTVRRVMTIRDEGTTDTK